jgi:hypothetical protein
MSEEKQYVVTIKDTFEVTAPSEDEAAVQAAGHFDFGNSSMFTITEAEEYALTKSDKRSWFSTVWDALHSYREDCIPTDDEQWDEICTAMAWIEEEIDG